ncbi:MULTISPECIES: hypothetical protein [Chelativorans]|jgi:hypothetical protein|nr:MULTISPECIES: hypothetical protein [Chelativorans]
MQKILAATSALFLLGSSVSFAQGVDSTVTTGSIGPTQSMAARDLNEQFKPSDEDNLPYSLRDDDVFDNEMDTNTAIVDSPLLRPLAGQETETFSARDENLPPENETIPGG